ncbi:MAG: putative toxin-antitoxin system toxin component, PIN family [Nitrospirae bacterium]|nr:putative toxin-antitoxin system toxin component, PIN family [Nitrospirota bacterium]
MGKKKEEIKKVVLDTNVLISALLFRGETARLVELWKKGRIIPVISRETFEEFRDVLAYPKFRLNEGEIKTIIEEEVLPFFEAIEIEKNISGICRDPNDDKFITCAISAPADYIVSGDKDLCDLGSHKSVRIIKVSDFLNKVATSA